MSWECIAPSAWGHDNQVREVLRQLPTRLTPDAFKEWSEKLDRFCPPSDLVSYCLGNDDTLGCDLADLIEDNLPVRWIDGEPYWSHDGTWPDDEETP